MEERKEINFVDFDNSFLRHAQALQNIKNYDFTKIDKDELLSILKFNLFTGIDPKDKFEVFVNTVVNDDNVICLSVWLVKHIDWVTSEHRYIVLTPYDAWVKTSMGNIHFRHKSLTNAWCSYLLKKYPLYLSSLTNFLAAERTRLHSVVDKEMDEKLKLLSILV